MSQNQETFRWGVLGPGGIARKFAKGLQVLPDHALVAVGSRSQESADAFAARFDIPHAHASYEDLVADPDVDIVYVASPHSHHLEHAALALEAGKLLAGATDHVQLRRVRHALAHVGGDARAAAA